MGDIMEIRWHGRGGQGAKTAALMLAQVVAAGGRHVQGFPEYGPERMGAPIRAYTRISQDPIRVHAQIQEPDAVVVLDPTLLDSENVTEGIREDGVLLANTSRDAGDLADSLGGPNVRVYTLDASAISSEAIGRPIPNTTMLGALVGVVDVLDWETFRQEARQNLEHRFSGKEDVIEGNMKAIERAHEEVKTP